MSSILDASAILAYLQQEPGEQIVESVLDAGPASVTSVNYCEVLSKLCEKGMPPAEARSAVDALGLNVVDFDVDLALRSASLRLRTQPIGASLGDRACLALAERATQSHASSIVYTAERSWTKLKWAFRIVVIRGGNRSK